MSMTDTLKRWRWYLYRRLYPGNNAIDTCLMECMQKEITNLELVSSCVRLLFSDRSLLVLWDSNFKYAWLSQGTYYEGLDVKFQWYDQCPRRFTAYTVFNTVTNYMKDHCDQTTKSTWCLSKGVRL